MQCHWGYWQRCIGHCKRQDWHTLHPFGVSHGNIPGQMPGYTKMHIGQWSSNAFLCYIRKQVMEFSHNVLRKMLSFQNYQHVPNFEHQIPENNMRQRNNPNNAKMRQNVGGDVSRQV
jgi:hypothetical protein